MSEDRQRILNMLKDGKVSVEEADELLKALAEPAGEAGGGELMAAGGSGRKLKYLRVQVEPENGRAKERVNVRIPLALVRAGAKLTTMLPQEARDKMDEAFKQKGIGFDLNELKSENIEALLEALGDMSIDVEADDKKIKIFCE